ncbi:hypothetical protein LCGC14_3151580, partial [marine sediment metagenome]
SRGSKEGIQINMLSVYGSLRGLEGDDNNWTFNLLILGRLEAMRL